MPFPLAAVLLFVAFSVLCEKRSGTRVPPQAA